MKYAIAFAGGAGRGRRPLEDGSTRETLARDCRDAALAFMSGVTAGWTKLDLALWLTGPYASVTRHAKHGERLERVDDGADAPDVTVEAVEQLLAHVQGQLLASLEKAAVEVGILDFSEESIARGHVRKVVDAEGRPAWVPVDAHRMRLRDRLRSLFTADYLNAPYTYAELFVCQRCEAVVFDEHTKQSGICGIHRTSGLVPRNGETAVPHPSASASGDDES